MAGEVFNLSQCPCKDDHTLHRIRIRGRNRGFESGCAGRRGAWSRTIAQSSSGRGKRDDAKATLQMPGVRAVHNGKQRVDTWYKIRHYDSELVGSAATYTPAIYFWFAQVRRRADTQKERGILNHCADHSGWAVRQIIRITQDKHVLSRIAETNAQRISMFVLLGVILAAIR